MPDKDETQSALHHKDLLAKSPMRHVIPAVALAEDVGHGAGWALLLWRPVGRRLNPISRPISSKAPPITSSTRGSSWSEMARRRTGAMRVRPPMLRERTHLSDRRRGATSRSE